MKRKIIMATIGAILLISSFAYASDTELSPNDVSATTSVTQDELIYEVIEPNDSMENSEEAEVTDEVSNEDVEAYTSQVVVNESLDPNKNGSDVYKFTATSAEPYYKVFISNTSNYPLHVSITKNSASGPEASTPYDIPAHSNSTTYYKASGLGDEDRYVNVSSPTSTALSGTISVKIATTQGELG